MKNSSLLNPTDIFNFPPEWKKDKFYNLFRVIKETSDNVDSEDVLSLTQKGILKKDIESNKGQIAGSYSDYTKVIKGDLVFNPMDLISGWVDVVSDDGVISPSYLTFRPNLNKVNPIFISYIFQMLYLNRMLFNFGKGVASHDGFGRWSINEDVVLKTNIFIPKKNVQDDLVKYITKKMTIINKLIFNSGKKIKLLNEQKKSTTFQFVTKGLNTNIEFKDSGVEWIGKVPKNWMLCRIKTIAVVNSGNGFKVDLQGYSSGDIPFYKVSDTNLKGNEKYLSVSSNYISDELRKSNKFNMFDKNSIIFPKIGATLKLNKRRIATLPCCIDNNMAGISLRSNDNVEYFYHLMTLVDFNYYCSDGTIPAINNSQIETIPIVIPPVSEQEKIVKLLNSKLENIEKLIDIEQEKISKLKELKISYIFSAITGKVKL